MFNSWKPVTHFAKAMFLGSILMFLFGAAIRAHAQCSSPANAIIAENCMTGSPSGEWDIGAGKDGDLTIQGFATDMSVNQGGTIAFKINTPASLYTIDIYRAGYYGGRGARKITSITPSARLPQTQPACMKDGTSGTMSTGLWDCGNWSVSASWQVPANATSGVYFAHLIRNDTGGDSHIVFIVRNDASHSAILYQTADETWQAYNYYGGGSLYSQAKPIFDLTDRAYKVSYNRPVLTRGFNQEWDTWFFGAEFAMVQWLEQNGYDVTYFTGVDAARSGALIKNHKIYMDAGHDEYWSAQHRANVQAARDAGVNLAFFSGNTMFWKTRWENSIDGSNTANRTLVCYKETLASAKIDTQNPTIWTGTWRDPSFSPPADGGAPENALTGTLFMINGTGPDNDGSQQVKVPAADGKMRFWRNTTVANQAPGATYTTPSGTLGYEWDVDVDNGLRPAGQFQLSTSTYQFTADYLLDFGATYGAGTATHHAVMYRAPSGALVFNAGTIDWSWGLNSNHDSLFNFANPNPDPNMQQATVNLFADMGVQPGSLQAGLVNATASTDAAPPNSAITYPTSGAQVNTGSTITVTGTASDAGGNVAGVEFSPDGGTTWHPAVGRGSWSYAWTPTTTGAQTKLLSRAVDDSANLETPTGGVVVNVAAQTCPCSIWGSKVPTTADSGDGGAVEVGVKFRPDSDGSILGVRFYKSTKNTGSHIGHLWTESGTLLGTVNFSGESASGWQQANFATPISVSANTIYVVSYYAPAGHYAADPYYFLQSGVDNPPLHALANGVDGADGVFFYPPTGTLGGFPSSGSQSSNYWVDVSYTSSNTFNISGNLSGPGGAGATVNLTGTETGSTTADASGNYSFAGAINGTYTVTPTHAGVTFSPSSRTVTVSGSALGGVNFTSVVTNPQSISGTVTNGAGTTLTLSGGASATTTVDASGNYSFTGLLSGSYSISPSASGLIFTPSVQNVTLSGSNATGVNFQAQVCNCISIFPATATPSLIDSNDGTPLEVGVKFQADTAGSVVGVRFYKASTNAGTHIGHLWTKTGTLLGSATFTSETASGWQLASFSTPIQISPGTTYVVSYYAPSGHYSADTNYFASTVVNNPPLHALQDGADGSNGIYLYTSSQMGSFPTNSYSASNYWVDVVYAGNAVALASIRGTISGGAGATVALTGGSSATTTADSAGNYIFNGVAPGTYSVVPSLTNAIFSPGNQNVTINGTNITGVNFSVLQLCPCTTVWKPSVVPGTVDSGDGLSYELGVKFKADTDGYILGVRFYKATTNTGTHVAHLWLPSSSTNPLTAATFSNEAASGWQQVLFATPVPVSANSTYIASYFDPAGHYSINAGFFSAGGVDSPPLHALADGADGQNGIYSQSSTSQLPTSAFNGSNYWVDVIYASTTTHSIGGIVTGTGAAGATVTLSGAASSTTTTDSFGNYRFNGLADGTYTVTPSNAGIVFSPGSQSVTLSGAHSLKVNFTSGVPTYVVSGTVAGGAGIGVSLAGATTITTTADASGNYTFPAVANGTYTVTPSGPGYAVSPTNQNVTVNGANVGSINFTATALAYTISGSISGGAGAAVSLTGSTNLTTVADALGNYSFPGITNGSYTVVPAKSGLVFVPTSLTATVVGANVSGVNFAVPPNCPCNTIWQPSTTPTVIDVSDNASVELGVKFRSDTSGFITGIRFYKSAANTGVHQGNLWSSTGTLLANVTFIGESASGWQEAFFSTPVAITANTTYVASYFAPAGNYSATSGNFINAGVDAPPLHALADGADGPNGVYVYSAASTYPNNSAAGANYYVDVIYTANAAQTFTITGTISGGGGSGATISLSGASTTTTTANASGAYTFSGLVNGLYTVTPAKSGFTFTPTNQAVTISGANATANFNSTAQTFTIAGTISGAGGNSATVSLSGASTATTTSNASGAYSFTVPNGSYTVTPAKSGFTFTPLSQSVTVSGANATAKFSSAQNYTLSGTISGSGGSGATVTLTGPSSQTATANSSGVYSFSVPNGSYTVTPTKSGFTFTPSSQAVTINGANGTANFSSAVQTFTLSGTISGTGGSGATVKLSGSATQTVTANSSGVYSFSVANGSYTVTPSKSGFTFTPPSQTVTVSGANATANFSSAQNYTLSGTISGSGGSGATVTLTGPSTQTATANSSGVYSFSVPNGTYTVTPNKSGFTYTPTSRSITISGANGSANFSSAVQTFTLSGTISGTGGSGATVRLSGSATQTVTANSSGVYSFSVPNGTYTVTPSKSGFTYTPTSQTVSINGANASANFTSATQTFSISGTVSGGSGATVKLSGAATANVTANSSGVFTFTGLSPGSYTITPSKPGKTIFPSTQTTTINAANVTGIFFFAF